MSTEKHNILVPHDRYQYFTDTIGGIENVLMRNGSYNPNLSLVENLNILIIKMRNMESQLRDIREQRGDGLS